MQDKHYNLDSLLHAAEVDVEVVERREECAEGSAGGHLREGVDVLREALAAAADDANVDHKGDFLIVWIGDCLIGGGMGISRGEVENRDRRSVLGVKGG